MKQFLKNVWSIIPLLSELIIVVLFMLDVAYKKPTQINYLQYICVFLIFIMVSVRKAENKE